MLHGKPTGTVEAESISHRFLMISVWLLYDLQVITGQTEEGFDMKKGFCEPKLTLSGATSKGAD